jgi:hypothetical protein
VPNARATYGPSTATSTNRGCKGDVMTFIWFVAWLIANNVGAHEPLAADPVNAWTGALILAIALDLGAAHADRARP